MESKVTGRMLYRMFFLGRNFCTLKP